MSRRTSRRLRRMFPLFARREGAGRAYRSIFLLLIGAALGAVLGVLRFLFEREKPEERHSIESRLEQFGVKVDKRLRPAWEAARASYPPTRLLFVAYKKEKRLDVYSVTLGRRGAGFGAGTLSEKLAGDAPLRALAGDAERRFIKSYPILGASGELGPKKQEGDRQVPEGFYGVEYLNPNSSYHLSMKIGYPNADDRAQAAREGRTQLGGDIMIHGSSGSTGCLAMGDPAAEELFVLAARAGVKNVEVLISPVDFRQRENLALDAYDETVFPEWVQALHRRIRVAVECL